MLVLSMSTDIYGLFNTYFFGREGGGGLHAIFFTIRYYPCKMVAVATNGITLRLICKPWRKI